MRKKLLLLALLLGICTISTHAEEGVAVVGDVKYSSLAEAIAAANPEEEVILLTNANESVLIDKNLTLNLNNNTLTAAAGSAIKVVNGANASINAGTVTGATDSGIYVADGNVTLTNLTITGNTTTESTRDGGGVNIDAGSLAINSSIITNNSAADGGGGIAVQPGASLTMSNSTITYNIGNEAGGIYLTGTSGTISGSNISNNSTRNDTGFAVGGGIYVGTNTYAYIGGTSFNTNYAQDQGGAICNYGGIVELNSSNFNGNSANYGGAVMGYMGNISISPDTIVTANTATYGGGVFSSANNLTILDGAQIYNNTGSTAAADIYSYGGVLSLGSIGSGLILSDDSEIIDGWYVDYSPRWNTEYIEPATNASYGIKAAHGVKQYTSYTVSYIDRETNLPIVEDKLVEGVEMGAWITEQAPTFEGYTLASDSEVSMTIDADAISIYFYYNINKKVPSIEPSATPMVTPTPKPTIEISGPTYKPKPTPTTETIGDEMTPQVAPKNDNYSLVRTDCKAEAFN